MICPSCGAGLSQKMVAAGECGYCHTALPKQAPDAPKVVNVTKIEIRAPDLEVGHAAAGLFNVATARLAGCFTGCLSMGVSVVITAMILAFVGWQMWMQSKSFPSVPSIHPAPHASPKRGRH